MEATALLQPRVLVADILVSPACYPEWAHPNIGALIMRIGFEGI